MFGVTIGRFLVGVILVASAACATVTPQANLSPAESAPAHAATADATERWRTRPADATCGAHLAALARAEIDAFRGLGICGRIDAENTLGSSGDKPSRFEQLGEYRVYSAGGNSILVWFVADNIRVIQLLYPKLPRPLEALLGPPGANAASQLSADWDQWIYADRGLTAHVNRETGEVVTLFAYKPTTVAEFLRSDIARVSKSESPLEELR
jgi:hypothetical protein